MITVAQKAEAKKDSYIIFRRIILNIVHEKKSSIVEYVLKTFKEKNYYYVLYLRFRRFF